MASNRPVGGGRVRIPLNFVAPTGRLDAMSGTLRCYGRMASLAELDPNNTQAWFATRFWAVQSMSAAAAAHLPPSNLETDLSAARAAASHTASRAARSESDECDRAMNTALRKAQ